MGLPESDGETPRRLNADKAAECKTKAMEELKAQGVSFPVEMDYYIKAGDQNAQDTETVLKQAISECLGDDFIKLNIGTFVSSVQKEVVEPRLQSVIINGWGADYGDPQNYLGQETYGEDTAYYSENYSHINEVKDEKLIATTNAMFGIQNHMYKNWDTSVEAYTTEQYEKFEEDFNK